MLCEDRGGACCQNETTRQKKRGKRKEKRQEKEERTNKMSEQRRQEMLAAAPWIREALKSTNERAKHFEALASEAETRAAALALAKDALAAKLVRKTREKKRKKRDDLLLVLTNKTKLEAEESHRAECRELRDKLEAATAMLRKLQIEGKKKREEAFYLNCFFFFCSGSKSFSASSGSLLENKTLDSLGGTQRYLRGERQKRQS